MMKKLILMLNILAYSFVCSQTGKVGIGTSTPTESYDTNGTARVRSLPVNGTASAIYTTGANTNSGTTPTKLLPL